MLGKRPIYGAAYYPELWDEATLERDIAHMHNAGINAVRIGEFAWSTMEPTEGNIDLSFFIHTIQKLHEHDISVILCTPTPTPPIWITHGHPERMLVDRGHPFTHGGRQHICTNNPVFRSYAARIVEAEAKACGQLPGVIAWQLDNEFKCNVSECYCAVCEEQWHRWLEKKYGTIDALNAAWGTAVWSQSYTSFDEIPTDRRATTQHNPALSTNYRLFSRERITDFAAEQAAIIRKWSDRPITHNSSNYFHVDNDSLFASLDFASFDAYPSAKNYREFLFHCDRFRGIKSGRPYLVMETSPGFNGHTLSETTAHPRGFVAAETAAATALGSAGIAFWHFRQHYSGSEMTHGAILSPWGEPTVCYPDVQHGAEVLRALEPILEDTVLAQAKVVIHYSDIGRAFILTEHTDDLEYNDAVRKLYDVLLDANIHRDLLPVTADPTPYAMVVTPFLFHIPRDLVDRMLEYVRGGGIWLVGPMSGIRTADHTMNRDAALTQRLEDAAGVHVPFVYPAAASGTHCVFGNLSSSATHWATALESRGASILAHDQSSYCPGAGLLSEHRYGKGILGILGCLPDPAMLHAWLQHFLRQAKVTAPAEASEDILLFPRIRPDGSTALIAIDMGGQGGTVRIGDAIHTVPPYKFINI